MKVVCLKSYKGDGLTTSKTYDVITIDKYDDYIIIDDNNHEDWYPNEWFKPLSEIRNEKIDKLLSDEVGYKCTQIKKDDKLISPFLMNHKINLKERNSYFFISKCKDITIIYIYQIILNYYHDVA